MYHSEISPEKRPKHCGKPMHSAGDGIWECLRCDGHVQLRPGGPDVSGRDVERAGYRIIRG